MRMNFKSAAAKRLATIVLPLAMVFSANAQSDSRDMAMANKNELHVSVTDSTKAKFTETANDVSVNAVKDPRAVKEGELHEAEKLSAHGQVDGRNEKGMLVISLMGPAHMVEKMMTHGEELHKMYEDPNRKNNTETGVRYTVSDDLESINVLFWMDGDTFDPGNGKRLFTVDQAKKYANGILGMYKDKFVGYHVPATPSTPLQPRVRNGIVYALEND